MPLTTNPSWSWIQPGQNGKTGVRSEEGWELSPAESLGWLSQKCCWEGRWRERLERLCYSIPHPVLATQWQQSCWILHMKGEGDGEKVLPFKEPRWQRTSEKAYGIRESKFTLFWVRHRRQAACTGGLPGQLDGLFRASCQCFLSMRCKTSAMEPWSSHLS